MPSRYYLPIRHDVIAKYLHEAKRKKKDPKCKIEYKGNEFIDQYNGTEYWWNARLNTREMSLSINMMELNIGGMLLLKQL